MTLLLAVQVAAGAWLIVPPAPTVGDTVLLERVIPAPADARLRAPPLQSDLLLEPLADPVVERIGAGIRLRYAVALFEPGRHPVAMPPVELLYRDGRVDVVSTDTAWVSIWALVPRGDSLPPPRGSLAPVARFPTRRWPLALLLGIAGLGTAAWAVSRRRVNSFVESARPQPPAGRPPLARWATTGEGRAVTAVAAERLRGRIATVVPEAGRSLGTDQCLAVLERQRPEWPLRDLAEVLRELDRSRFAPAAATEVTTLVSRADELAQVLQ